MAKSISNYIKNFGVHFVQTQLVVTLVALPILISWGLGISVMTFLGNLLFAPILTIFLILSSLVLFTQLLDIPNGLLTQVLDCFTSLWHILLQTGSHDWVFTFAHPGLVVLIMIPIVMFFTLTHHKIKTNKTRIFMLSTILGVSILGLFVYQKVYVEQKIQKIYYHEKLTIEQTNKKLILIDNGFFAQKKTAEKTVAFEIRPYLTKTYGSLPITEIKLLQPAAGSFAAAQELCTTCTVEKVSLPYFDENLSKFAWKKYFELQKVLKEKNIVFEQYELPSGLKKSCKNRRDRSVLEDNVINPAAQG